jgi:glycosyltransferase involved in cell wall biosynthesis
VRILDVSPRAAFPPNVGSTVRTHNLLSYLSRDHIVIQFAQNRWDAHRKGATLRRVSLRPGYDAYEYSHPLACAVVEASERAWTRAPLLSGAALALTRPRLLDRLIARVEVTLVEFPWQFAYCRRINRNSRLVLACHNVELLKFRDYARVMNVSVECNRWLGLVELMERRAIAHADLITAVSATDKNELVNRYGVDPSRVVEIPNGVDTDRYHPATPNERAALKRRLELPERPTVIFVGAGTPPNWAALRWIRDLANLTPELNFVVVGAVVPDAHRSNNLLATGVVADHRSYLQAADIALCPVRFGGGTKIKLFEYLATGLATLAFQESIRGTDLRSPDQLIVVDQDRDALLVALRRLAGDCELRRRMGTGARQFVRKYNDWRWSGRKLELALLRLVESGRGAR